VKFNFKYLDESKQACPLCQGEDFTTLSKNDRYFMGIQTVGCNTCGLIQTNPRPSEAGIRLFYERDYRTFYQGVSEPNEKYIYEMKKKERLRDSARFLSQLDFIDMSSAILDIGCSEGIFFHALKDTGFIGELYGIEPNPEFREFAEKSTGAFVYGELSNLQTKVNLVTLNHVFEHFVKPNEFLMALRNIIEEDGYLYIDVPNAQKYNSIDDIHIAHVFHYTKKTLSQLVELVGFVIIHCEEYSPKSHPKSIRLIAKKNTLILNDDKKVLLAEEDIKVWGKIKKLSVWKKKMRVTARKIPFMKSIYHAVFKK